MSEGDVLELVRAAGPHLQPAGPETESWLARLEERHDSRWRRRASGSAGASTPRGPRGEN